MDIFSQAISTVFSLLLVWAGISGAVLAFVQFAKETLTWKGKRILKGTGVKVFSFICGAILGGLIFWVYISQVEAPPLPVMVLMLVLLVLMSGLSASGFYDYQAQMTAKRIGVTELSAYIGEIQESDSEV